ncbi:ATPase V1 complex subunit H [Dichomitus squalens]|uniref:V-type proton ATPase subunit H n=1 Tax=Dichomitus squalens TaxID=114155 RepID=A0A4Q9PD38_9APHY|nr:ATPase V1 complex subunit H [Dichomitus squalens LYAD-421 SS1]EJF62445.1 ATPase V1 complex subunit H [Dichomitus squalens LYAD-421 SS1]TBU50116.1 ATPase V1 complex subunit H [Dichomitus squalens]TBU66138.1 ATPase V1 complex subunit H [Dichomitus squalens]
MSITLVSNSYLDENSAKIRAKPVPWEGYQRAGLITPDELALIKKVDRQTRPKIESLHASDGQTYALLYLRLLKKLQRIDTQSCILVLIADALTDHEERIPLFTTASQSDPELPYSPLLRILESQDDFVQLKATQILTVLLSSEKSPLQVQQLQPFLNTLAQFVANNNLNKRDVAVQCLEAVLPRPEVRRAVWANTSLVAGLADILKHNSTPQMSYQVGFCFWLLTFEQEVAEQIQKRFDIIPLLVDVAQGAAKEKVIRVIVATFRNLVSKAPQANLPAMLVAQLLPFAKNLSGRKWTDEDIVEDIQFLRDELSARFDSLTTYDEYRSELLSGHLSWTPVHESDLFWKENATKLNDKDYELLKILIRLLKESNDPTVLAVAAHDVGQYVKHYQLGKKVLTDLGAKTRVMELLSHSDPEVRYQALISVQRLVSHPWAGV